MILVVVRFNKPLHGLKDLADASPFFFWRTRLLPWDTTKGRASVLIWLGHLECTEGTTNKGDFTRWTQTREELLGIIVQPLKHARRAPWWDPRHQPLAHPSALILAEEWPSKTLRRRLRAGRSNMAADSKLEIKDDVLRIATARDPYTVTLAARRLPLVTLDVTSTTLRSAQASVTGTHWLMLGRLLDGMMTTALTVWHPPKDRDLPEPDAVVLPDRFAFVGVTILPETTLER